MAYYYAQQANYYGENNGAANVSYIRDSRLTEIDYGFADGDAYGTAAPVPDRVIFTPAAAGRCVVSRSRGRDYHGRLGLGPGRGLGAR